MVYKYGFRNGVAGLNIGESKLKIFALDAKQALRNAVTDNTVQLKMFPIVFNVHFDRENVTSQIRYHTGAN